MQTPPGLIPFDIIPVQALIIIPFRFAAVSKRSPLQLLLHQPEYPATALVHLCNKRRVGMVLHLGLD